jgi:F420-0:gamma-glutamyl ligase
VSLATRALAVHDSDLPRGIAAIPVRTALVRHGDDLTELAAAAVKGIARPGDVVAISETAVAIAQGEFVAAERVRPTQLAYALSRRAGVMATVNQPESMQIVIDRTGRPRVLLAVAAHLAGRLFGRRGGFYEVLGDAIAAVDGYTGTMPPFERAIVLAPREPDAVARMFRRRTGIECAVVDANDLRRAKVLGASARVERPAVERALLHNPHGNGDEQTPIVVLKWRGAGQNPLLQPEP